MSCEVCPMDVDSEYMDSENKKENDQSDDDEGSINNSQGSNEDIYKKYYQEFGENCLYNLSIEELDEIYVDIYGEEPAFNLNKMDIIKCISEYYDNDTN